MEPAEYRWLFSNANSLHSAGDYFLTSVIISESGLCQWGGPSISHVLAQSCTCFQSSGGIEICKYVQELHVSLIPQIPLLNLSTIWTVCWSHQPLSSPKATSIFSSLDCLPLTRITIVSSSWEHELFFFCALQMKPAPSGSKAEALTAFFLSR